MSNIRANKNVDKENPSYSPLVKKNDSLKQTTSKKMALGNPTPLLDANMRDVMTNFDE